MVLLKVEGTTTELISSTLFTFHYGSIKRGKGYREISKQVNLHSTMVLLKEPATVK